VRNKTGLQSFNWDNGIVVSLVFIAYIIYKWLDPTVMLQANINDWDSWQYQGLSDQMMSSGFSNLSGLRPFCYRLVQPGLATLVRTVFGKTYAEASHTINIASTFLVAIFSFNFWRSQGLSRSLSFIGIGLITVSFLGPLRVSIYYPGGQFAFEVLLTCVSFWALKRICLTEKAIDLLFPSLALFAATIGRESIFYLIVASALILAVLGGKDSSHETIRPLAAVTASLLGYISARIIVSAEGEYSVLKTIFDFGWFHLNLAESLYMYAYSLGPFFLSFLLCVSFPRSRRELFKNLSVTTSIDNRLICGFCFASFIFAFVGGTDSDRFILWSFPFYFYIGLSSLAVLARSIPNCRIKTLIASTFLVTALLWSRFYVPAIPYLMFTDKFNSQAGVKTNLNPALFRGVPALIRFRNKVVEVSPSEAYNRIGKSSDRELQVHRILTIVMQLQGTWK
jgi:hypothetical protein